MVFNPNARLDPSQVQDRRGRGGMPGGPVIAGGGGIGVLVLIAALLLGVNPFEAGFDPSMQPQPTAQAQGQASGAPSAEECQTGADANRRQDCRIVGFVNSIQSYWSDEFARRGWQYVPAKTVLFSEATQAACGYATGAQGPFYCPADQLIYLDLSFFQELETRFGARGGPFAQAYVVAHEYGHHVQHVRELLPEGRAGATGPQSAAVRVELQADCLAGVWVHHASATGYLQPPSERDIADALSAAAAVGDDRIQRQAQGRVSPESWTHGSSEQRQQWFSTGHRTGDPSACDTSGGRV